MKLLIATRNKGKLPEILAVLRGLPFELVSLNDVENIPKDFDVNETGQTFEENAILKARVYGKKAGIITLADDSGLSVDALGGRPGVYSARYVEGKDKDRNNKILQELSGVPTEKRTARYIAAMAIYDPKGDKVRTCEGTCEGVITTEPIGENGFGYDPIFFSTDLGKTTAQATMEEKSSISHRGKALREARKILAEIK